MIRLRKLFILLLSTTFLFSCRNNDPGPVHPVPNVPVYVQINLDHPEFFDLSVPGGYYYLENEGARGIIIINYDGDNFYAHDRNCPYHVQEACAQVTMESSGLVMKCGHLENGTWVDCCGSEFGQQGFVLKGPAQYPLKSYFVSKSGSVVTISN
jgi:hypothetical protein